MKIATYNIWNDDRDRTTQLIQTIETLDADVIGLQEVTSRFYAAYQKVQTRYAHCVYHQYPGEDEGLALFSKFPIHSSCNLFDDNVGNSRAINVQLVVGESLLSVTNLHLPWDSALEKERQICVIDRFIHTQLEACGLMVLLGDFNGGMGSSVHRYLVGDQSLLDQEANPYWDELATGNAALTGETIRATLDTITNPRWRGSRTAYPPTVMDRIYTLENTCDLSLESLSLFGTEISQENGLAPSDHYGVVAEVTIKE